MSMERGAQRVFIALILLSLFLLALVVRPFAEALFFAAVLTGALYPLHRRLARKLARLFRPRGPVLLARGTARFGAHTDERRALSAGILCFAVVLALLMPVGGIAAFAIKESVHGVRFVAETVRSEGVTGLIGHLPEPLENGVNTLLERMPGEEQELDAMLQRQASAQTGKAARAVTDALAATGTALLQSALMLIAMYFLLVDGAELVSWLEQISPLAPGQTTELLQEFRKVSAAVLVSSLATAGLQALVAFVGYLIARVPHPVFFATVTFFFAFVPALGAGGVALAVSLLLVLLGHPWAALFLALWGVLIVGLVDNIVKPLLVKRGMSMHGGLVFFALLGGLAAFGSVGLIAGPLTVAFFLALVRIYQRDYGGARASAPEQNEDVRAAK
jgi:predicted PurR-regulated permease PerM